MFYTRWKHAIETLKRVTAKQLCWCRQYLGRGSGEKTREECRRVLWDLHPNLDSSCYVETERRWKPQHDCTVIVAAYNAEQYIQECLDSIKRQRTRYLVQVIVVDDGSTDNTRSLLREYKNLSHWSVVCQNNQGLSSARNKGIEHATGRYLMFVDADDTLCENALNSLLSVAYEKEADLVVGGYRVVVNDREDCILEHKYEQASIVPLGKATGHAWGKIYAHEVFAHLKFPEGYWFEDSIVAQIIYPMIKNAYAISAVIYQHRDNPAGIVKQSEKSPKVLDSFYIVEKILQERYKFGLKTTMADIQQFAHNVQLTYSRTCSCGDEVANCIFLAQCELYSKLIEDVGMKKSANSLERALAQRHFRKYLRAVWKATLQY